jgi:hypothetical protein
MRTKTIKLIFFTLCFVFLTSLACNFPGIAANDALTIDTNELDSLETSVAEPIQFQAGTAVSLSESTISPSGGQMVISGTDSIMDGFSIAVSPDTYSEPVTFSISYLPIESHNLPPDLLLITPLIQVDNGGVTSNNYLEITLPTQLNEDQFAMLFIFNEENGTLEPLPLVSQDSTQLVALTTHFSKLLGVAIDKSKLDSLKIKTGYTHGTHNWQFGNYKTYIVPKGYCFGSVITSLYNYLVYDKTQLYGVFDNYNNNSEKTPDQPLDDRLGIRLVSLAQQRLNMITLKDNYWIKVQQKQDQSKDQSLTFYSIALALKVSSEPQLLFYLPETGTEGHAVIIYGKSNQDFYISDPNRPKPSWSYLLIFDHANKKFEPIRVNALMDGGRATYTRFYYMNKYDFIQKNQMLALWSDFLAGSIGQVEYPATQLYISKNYASSEDRGPDSSILINNSFIFVDTKDMSTSGNKIWLFESSADVSYVKVFDTKEKVVTQNKENIIIKLTEPAGTPYLFTFWGNADAWIDGKWITFYQSLTGVYNGGRCSESETEPHHWDLDIVQKPDGSVNGDLYFHACPGGGAVFYSVSGTQKPGEAIVTLTGTKTGGRGELGNNCEDEVEFKFGLKYPLSPNYAP